MQHEITKEDNDLMDAYLYLNTCIEYAMEQGYDRTDIIKAVYKLTGEYKALRKKHFETERQFNYIRG